VLIGQVVEKSPVLAVSHVSVCSVIVLTKLITGNGYTSVVAALCVCIVLCRGMRTSSIGHLLVCTQFCVGWRKEGKICA